MSKNRDGARTREIGASTRERRAARRNTNSMPDCNTFIAANSSKSNRDPTCKR